MLILAAAPPGASSSSSLSGPEQFMEGPELSKHYTASLVSPAHTPTQTFHAADDGDGLLDAGEFATYCQKVALAT